MIKWFAAFFAFGATMCALIIVLLLFPGSGLDSLWRLNADARLAFRSLGKLSILLMFVVGTACTFAALARSVLLFGYGFSLNLAPVEFRHVVGLNIATLFVVWQSMNFIVFRTSPNLPILVGGTLIVLGGLIVTFWKT